MKHACVGHTLAELHHAARFTQTHRQVEEELVRDLVLAGNDDAPLVYFSFGSLGVADVDLIKRMITVLGRAPYRVLVNVGDHADQYGDPPENVKLGTS